MPQSGHSHFQALEADAKRTVTNLAPLLRIADALDRGHEQKIKRVTSVIRDGSLNLLVESESDPDLEIWAANEAAETFRESYAKPIAIQRRT